MLNHFNLKINLVALAFCFAPVSDGLAQDHRATEPIYNGDNYETALAGLDSLAQTAGNDKLVILIARLGRGETTSRLNRNRLQRVRNFLERERSVPQRNIVTAEGDREPGRARIEVYLEGKLFMVFTFARNKAFAKEQ